MVRACDIAELSRSGATVTTLPSGASASFKALRPGLCIPSSLVIRMVYMGISKILYGFQLGDSPERFYYRVADAAFGRTDADIKGLQFGCRVKYCYLIL